MMKYMLFLNQLFATELEWTNLSEDLKEIVTDDFEYEFVKATPVNDFWGTLDIKAVDVVGGCFWMYEDEDFSFYDEDLCSYTTAIKNGFFTSFTIMKYFKSDLKVHFQTTTKQIKRFKKYFISALYLMF